MFPFRDEMRKQVQATKQRGSKLNELNFVRQSFKEEKKTRQHDRNT